MVLLTRFAEQIDWYKVYYIRLLISFINSHLLWNIAENWLQISSNVLQRRTRSTFVSFVGRRNFFWICYKRAWKHRLTNRKRTLDIAFSVVFATRSEQFDFLVLWLGPCLNANVWSQVAAGAAAFTVKSFTIAVVLLVINVHYQWCALN